jgi:hypothetical protein
MSRRAIENILLYIFFVVIYCIGLGSIPPKMELFEEWVNFYLPYLDYPWDRMMKEFISIRPNDSNQSVNAPIWLLMIKGSRAIFGDGFVGTRLPAVLLSALAPVLMADWVRRFFRPDLALLAGIAVGAQQHVISFGRTGGYIGPTLTLLIFIFWLCSIIALENKRWPWIPLVVSLVVATFFYSPIRYYELVALGMIGYQFVRSRDFRLAHWRPALISLIVLAGVGYALSEGGKKYVALMYISGRGEQFLLTDDTLVSREKYEALPERAKMGNVLTTMVPEKLGELKTFYGNGKRFFNYRHQHIRNEQFWVPVRPWLLGLFFLGVARCMIAAISQQRYLVFLAWSVWAWVPLLVTTGITVNRMFLGVPADVIFLLLGLFVPVDLTAKYVSQKWAMIPKVAAYAVVLWFSYHSLSTYFSDYINFPNL